MTVWLVRAGAEGEDEELALSEGLAIIYYSRLGDLSNVDSREELKEIMQEAYPHFRQGTTRSLAGQLWRFMHEIEIGDLVVLPLKSRWAIAVGEVTGEYEYREDIAEEGRQTRPVNWLSSGITRSAFGQDLLYSMGAAMTVCTITRNDAEQRIRQVLETGHDPSLSEEVEEAEQEDGDVLLDLEDYALQRIHGLVGDRFREHDLEKLVGGILKAQGYRVHVTTAGPDGGVDIVAGKGAMGLDSPKIVVQVKSGRGEVGVNVLREMQGTMGRYGADMCLIVSWNGFTRELEREARSSFFTTQLWDSGKVIEQLLENYEQLPENIRADLPLRRIWIPIDVE